MNKILLLGTLALSLAACTPQYVWKKEGASTEKLDADLMACRAEMSRFGGNDAKDIFDNCMKTRGYEKETTGYNM